MKKTALFLLACILLFAGCSSSQTVQEGEALASSEDLTMPKPTEYVIMHGANENWEQDQASDFLQSDLIQTEESATTIANAVLEATVGKEGFQTYYLANVWKDIERAVWVVSYFPRSEEESLILFGGDITIVTRKHDAQIVKIWVEE